MRIRSFVSRASALFTVLFLSIFLLGAGEQSDFSLYVDSEGVIRLPVDFRAQMVHLGSWFVPEGDASGFHDVYSEASSVGHSAEPAASRTARPW